ncbi:MAG: hypothetical protein GIKADHBN_01084 [Phycisphaerales bacterium]|nr:hypothetical protein [Phycisphaerales bacterium]
MTTAAPLSAGAAATSRSAGFSMRWHVMQMLVLTVKCSSPLTCEWQVPHWTATPLYSRPRCFSCLNLKLPLLFSVALTFSIVWQPARVQANWLTEADGLVDVRWSRSSTTWPRPLSLAAMKLSTPGEMWHSTHSTSLCVLLVQLV